jgi:RNA polymerase sigma factor (sigma-70 family)
MTTVDEGTGVGVAERGDHAAFEAFYRATVKKVFATTCRCLYGNIDAAYEVVQEGYAAMWRSWSQRRSLPLDDNARYLTKIAYFKAVDHHRRFRPSDEFDEAYHCSDQNVVEDTVVARQGIFRLVRQRLDQEPARRRAVALMFFFDGFDADEIAETLKMSRSTVRTHIERSRKILRPYVERLDPSQGRSDE